jgi:hypothetical protein
MLSWIPYTVPDRLAFFLQFGVGRKAHHKTRQVLRLGKLAERFSGFGFLAFVDEPADTRMIRTDVSIRGRRAGGQLG